MFNPPSQIRTAIYIVAAFINGALIVSIARDVELPALLEVFIGGFNSVVALMAKVNVTPDGE